MDDNPYAPPTTASAISRVYSREQALRSLRIALIILLIPAAYNLYCFDYAGIRKPYLFRDVFRIANITGMTLIALFVWFPALNILEVAIRFVRKEWAPETQLSEWYSEIYKALRRAPYLAVPGAFLWYIWVEAFYEKSMSFALTLMIGAAAHLLAAFLYVPLLLGWYRLYRGTGNS